MTCDIDCLDLFAGCGGVSLGLELIGLRDLGFELADEECATREAAGFLTVQGDLSKISRPQEFAGIEGLWDSSPCFPPEVPVLTHRGMIPIGEVVVGDLVLTHRNRWRPVTRTMSRRADTVRIGHTEATADHPYWTRGQRRKWRDDRRGYRWFLDDESRWTPLGESAGRFVGIPEVVALPPGPLDVPAGDLTFWWMVGRWIGDGWTRIKEPDMDLDESLPWSHPLPMDCVECGQPARRHPRCTHRWTNFCSDECRRARTWRRSSLGQVVICCGDHEADKLQEALVSTGMKWVRQQERTTTRYTTSDRDLARWFARTFGTRAHNKTLPAWLFSMPDSVRRAVLDGYLSADGYEFKAGSYRASTVSRCLAISMRLLGVGLGFSTSLSRSTRSGASEIEGREVSERESWTVILNSNDGRYSRSMGEHRWVKLRGQIKPGREATVVVDLTVAEDESFVADGYVVHNCLDFSVAGKRAGRKGKSGWLVDEKMRWITAVKPRWVACENVPTVEPIFREQALELQAMGYRTWVGVLGSEEYGVPQTRDRAYLMAHRDHDVRPPQPTHQQYVFGVPAQEVT